MIIYGAQAQSFVGMGGMNLAEAEEFFAKYKGALPTLMLYQDRLKKRGKKDGTIYTYFGRPRRVKYYFSNRKTFSFGERTCLNTVIQGAAADILRLTFIKLWKNFFGHEDYKNKSRFLATVHDEVDFAIRKEGLCDTARRAETLMEFQTEGWKVPLLVEVSFGYSWGSTFPFEYNKDTGYYFPKTDSL